MSCLLRHMNVCVWLKENVCCEKKPYSTIMDLLTTHSIYSSIQHAKRDRQRKRQREGEGDLEVLRRNDNKLFHWYDMRIKLWLIILNYFHLKWMRQGSQDKRVTWIAILLSPQNMRHIMPNRAQYADVSKWHNTRSELKFTSSSIVPCAKWQMNELYHEWNNKQQQQQQQKYCNEV